MTEARAQSLDGLAALHGRCFSQPRPWSAREFEQLLMDPHAFLLTHNRDGLLMGRVVADEAEMLTLAVEPEARRMGIARQLVLEFGVRARDLGAKNAFLEVAATNTPARMLYRSLGWRETGLRRRYYGPHIDAVTMRLHLVSDQEGG